MSEQINNPHDQFFRAAFSRPDVAKSFLTNYLSPELAAKINLDSLEITQESFVDEELKAHHSDLLFRFRQTDGTDGFIYVLLEHKSYTDKLVGFQLLRYVLRIWEKSLAEKSGKLPPVLPIVLYHGDAEWKISRQFADLVENAADFGELIPDFKYGLWDLSKFDAEEIKTEVFLKAAVFVMQNIFDKEIYEKLDELGELYKLKRDKETVEFISIIVRYVLAVNEDITVDKMRKTLRKVFPKLESKIMTTATRELLEQGTRIGTETTAFRILQKKFGSLSEDKQNAIKNLSDEKLKILTLDFLDFNEQEDFDRWLKLHSDIGE